MVLKHCISVTYHLFAVITGEQKAVKCAEFTATIRYNTSAKFQQKYQLTLTTPFYMDIGHIEENTKFQNLRSDYRNVVQILS